MAQAQRRPRMDEHAQDLDTPNTNSRRREIDPVEAARERTSNFVRAICNAPLLELQHRQDEISNAVARIKKSEEALAHYIVEFARFCAEAEALAGDLKPIIEAAVTPFKADPPATITQLNGGAK